MADPRFLRVRLSSLGDGIHALPAAAALRDTFPGARTVDLFGPTDASRNGPFSPHDITVRNPQFCVTTYRRGTTYSPGMLSITVDQVFRAVECRMEAAA
jgi:ADP-heptose:LPS heptosyltransferase